MHLTRCKSGSSPSCTGRPRGPAKGEPPSTTHKSQYCVDRGEYMHLHMHLKHVKETHTVSVVSFVQILNESRSVFFIICITQWTHSGHTVDTQWTHSGHSGCLSSSACLDSTTAQPHHQSSSPLPRADARTACPRHHTKRPHPRPEPPRIIQLGLRAR
jgi:hypothetical protein